MNLLPEAILGEIEKRKTNFAELAEVNEIGMVETMFYDQQSGLYFSRHTNGIQVDSLGFWGTELWERSGSVIAEALSRSQPHEPTHHICF
jgi:hypothetical protein